MLLLVCSTSTFVQGPVQAMIDIVAALNDPREAVLKEDFLKRIPPGSSVVATFDLMPRLSDRDQLYSFHHIYGGYYTLSRRPYPLPPSVDHALLDTMDRLTFSSFYDPRSYVNMQRFLDTFHLSPVAVRDNLVLFTRDAVQAVELFSRSVFVLSPEDSVLFTDGVIVLNKVGARLRGEVLHLVLDWQAKSVPQKDVGMYVDLFVRHQDVRVRRSFQAVCYRIFPTQAWSAGERVIDRKYVTVPPELAGRDLDISIGFFDQNDRSLLGKTALLQVEKGD